MTNDFPNDERYERYGLTSEKGCNINAIEYSLPCLMPGIIVDRKANFVIKEFRLHWAENSTQLQNEIGDVERMLKGLIQSLGIKHSTPWSLERYLVERFYAR